MNYWSNLRRKEVDNEFSDLVYDTRSGRAAANRTSKWMNGIGWRIRGGRDSKHCFLVADTDENAALWMELDESAREWFGHDFYDCGENIEMFKALAAMNSDHDREQWFVAHAVIRFERLKDTVQTETGERLIMAGEWFKVLIPWASDIRAKWMAAVAPKQLCHKATKDEIIEHFNRKKL